MQPDLPDPKITLNVFANFLKKRQKTDGKSVNRLLIQQLFIKLETYKYFKICISFDKKANKTCKTTNMGQCQT